MRAAKRSCLHQRKNAALISTLHHGSKAVNGVIAASEARAKAQAFLAKSEAERIRVGLNYLDASRLHPLSAKQHIEAEIPPQSQE